MLVQYECISPDESMLWSIGPMHSTTSCLLTESSSRIDLSTSRHSSTASKCDVIGAEALDGMLPGSPVAGPGSTAGPLPVPEGEDVAWPAFLLLTPAVPQEGSELTCTSEGHFVPTRTPLHSLSSPSSSDESRISAEFLILLPIPGVSLLCGPTVHLHACCYP